jgi:carboxymethylenebutenolidase
MAANPSTSGYLVLPDGNASGPGVLVLHSWWGLTPFFKGVCDRLADEGFVALAPDLMDGRTVDDPEEARQVLLDTDVDVASALVRSSLFTLRSLPATPNAPVGVLGFSMGASWAMHLASRVPELVGAAVVFYGSQTTDMEAATSPFVGHFAESDELVSEDELTLMEADLRLLDKSVDFHRYPGTGHWFFESDRPSYDPAAADLAWARTIEFLHRNLDDQPDDGFTELRPADPRQQQQRSQRQDQQQPPPG